jgi:membrane fusion protein (multidrug efflux system)
MKNQIYLVCISIIISIIINSCGGNNGTQQKVPAVPVQAFQVKSGNAVYYDVYPASVTALNQVEIRPEVSGYLTGIYFKDGQQVSKGMKLYAIDQQQYKAAYDLAVANLNVSKANLMKAQQDADRYNDLAKQDAIAKQVLDHALADLETAKSQVAAAQSNVNAVETNYRNSVIYSPFNGTIGISLVKLGSAVSAGQTLLNTVSSDNPKAVDFSVDEKQIGKFELLLHKKTNGKDSTFSIILPDQTVYQYTGQLNLIDRAVDPQTGTIKARLIFPNPKDLLKSGLTCNVRVLNDNTANNMLIPYKAVVEQMGEYHVFIINGDRVSLRNVQLGMSVNDMIIVKQGLESGDQVVTDGVQKLRDNVQIVITHGNSKPAPQAAYGK